MILWPDKRLVTPADPIDGITDEIREIWRDMVDTMEAMPGVGMAATQFGIMMRLAVVDASHERGQAVLMANPEIIQSSNEMREHIEGSPNLPGVSAKLIRPARVDVRYMDHAGIYVRKEFKGLWSTSVQHQIDHLDGKLYVHRLSRTKRDMILKKVAKAR